MTQKKHWTKVRISIFVAAILAIVSALPACSVKPIDPGREGVFDRWSKFDTLKRKSGGDDSDYDEEIERRTQAVAKLVTDWRWPLKSVAVTSPYGQRGKKFHEGVDLRAATGTPVYSASEGSVLYSGRKIKGYGRMIVIRHPTGLLTVYAHNSKNLVKVGQSVKQGQKISLAGRSGHATGSHLHFEIRQGEIPLNPAVLLKLASEGSEGGPHLLVAQLQHLR